MVVNGVVGEINHRFFIAPFSVLKEETHLLCNILRGIYIYIYVWFLKLCSFNFTAVLWHVAVVPTKGFYREACFIYSVEWMGTL